MASEVSVLSPVSPFPLRKDAGYAFSKRALQKWVDNRLTLEEEFEEVRARFVFNGSTCSNMGFPLAFEYQVALGTVDQGYVIKEMSCSPLSGDEGYKKMCAYLDSPKRIMGSLEKEKPFLGSSLDEVVDWDPDVSPAGCLCSATSRNHKWRIVLQVLHYALVQKCG